MAYLTNTDLKTYLNVTGSTDDTLLTTLIAAAQKAVENYARRVFEAASDSDRYFTVGVDTDGSTLMLDRDLCAITKVYVCADGASPVQFAASDYYTRPRNQAPYYEIVIASTSSQYWRYSSTPVGAIKVTGKWAYSTSAPADIVHATKRLAGYIYRQRDAQVFDVTATELGLIIPHGMPVDVKQLLDPYIRATL